MFGRNCSYDDRDVEVDNADDNIEFAIHQILKFIIIRDYTAFSL